MTEEQIERLCGIWESFKNKESVIYEKAQEKREIANKFGTAKAIKRAEEWEKEAEERVFITVELQEAFVNVLSVFGYEVEINEADEIISITKKEEV